MTRWQSFEKSRLEWRHELRKLKRRKNPKKRNESVRKKEKRGE